MTTGWGNEDATDAVRRVLSGRGRSGRVVVLAIAAAVLVVGIVGGNLLLIVTGAVISVAALWSLIAAWSSQLAARRLERRARRDRS